MSSIKHARTSQVNQHTHAAMNAAARSWQSGTMSLRYANNSARHCSLDLNADSNILLTKDGRILLCDFGIAWKQEWDPVGHSHLLNHSVKARVIVVGKTDVFLLALTMQTLCHGMPDEFLVGTLF